MARYSIEFAKSVRKDLRKLSKRDVKKILATIDSLAEKPRPPGSKKLTIENLYRVRVGNYRILYEIHDDRLIVLIVKTGHRKEIYKK